MGKLILYIDMDGVIADFDKGVQSIEPGMLWDRENVDRVCENNPRVFSTLPEIEGGISAVQKLAVKYDVFFLSTPMCNIPESYMDKRKWLKEKFGSWVDKKLILTHRKDLNKGDFLIDDWDKNKSDTQNFIHFGSPEFPNWESILRHLL